jgi:hypothetical protein
MRRWQDLAAPDDPGSYYSVSGMWPTDRGTYETADISAGTTVTVGGVGQNVVYAFAAGRPSTTTTGTQEYILLTQAGSPAIYTYDGSTIVSVTHFFTVAFTRGAVAMVRYGDGVIVGHNGLAQKLERASVFGGFTELANSPTRQDILAVQSNAVLAFSSRSNTWAASDVGDPTNWTTGEAASGTIFTHPGNITAAVSYGNDVYVFKPASIHRMTYVGGSVKWQVQTAWTGYGVPRPFTSPETSSQDWAIATPRGIVFYGGGGKIYLFDGASAPVCLNPLTTIPVETIAGVFVYNPVDDVLCVAPGYGSSSTGTALSGGIASVYYYYSFPFQAWGLAVGSDAEVGGSDTGGVLRGSYHDRVNTSSKPVYWAMTTSGGSTLKRCAPTAPGSSASTSVQTSKFGRADGKTNFRRVIPLMRRREDNGSDSAVLTASYFREREDTSAQTTPGAIVESTYRKRFDLMAGTACDNFARFTVTWTALDVEIDDVVVKSEFVEDSD